MHTGVVDFFFFLSIIDVLCNLSFIIQQIELSITVTDQRALQISLKKESVLQNDLQLNS